MRTIVHARYGRAGTKVHLAASYIDSRGRPRLTSSVPDCGTYARPGAGVIVGDAVTCAKCVKMQSCRAENARHR